MIIFLGLPPLKNTLSNPLEFKHRKAMLEEDFKGLEIYYIDDHRDDEVWSKNLDKQLSKWVVNSTSITLYGSNENFIKKYNGKFPTQELDADCYVSFNDARKKIINSYPPTRDYRAGLIAATGLRYPTAYQTVDVAIVNPIKKEVLLVKKPTETLFRFCGGFSDPKSISLEADARREVAEETGVSIDNIQYIGSTIIDDWRYRYETDKLKTAFFIADYIFGCPQGADDVELAKWFHIEDLAQTQIVYEHHILLDMFLKSKIVIDILKK